MAEYNNAELAIIQRYDDSKSTFENIKSSYYGKVVFIAGSTKSTATFAEKKQYIWVSGEGTTTGRYIDFDTLDRFKKITIGSKTITAEGAATITMANGTGVSVTFSNDIITFALNDEYYNKINDTASKATTNATDIATLKTTVGSINTTLENVATKTELENAVTGLISDGNDTSADDTIRGAKAYADSVAGTAKSEAMSELLGEGNDALDAETIRGNKNAITAISTAFPVTITEETGSGDIAKVYTIKQGLSAIGTINIPKELVVTSGSVVAGTWSGTTFTESTSGTGKAIKLIIANQTTPIYINVKDLVDVYTAKASATEIQLAISATNEISATIVAVNGSKITDGTVTKTKLATAVQTSLGKADTAYQKPSAGIPKTDLASAVQTSLSRADNAISSIGVYIPTDDANYLSGNVGTSDAIRTINLDVKTETIGNATSDTTKKGLATAEDVAAFIKARLSVKVIS